MEEHFLKKYVEGQGEKGFQAKAWYNSIGDCIEYHTVNEAVVADRIDEKLTIYRSMIDQRPIGFKIKDVQAILSKYGCESLAVVSIEENTVLISLAAIILAAYEQGLPSQKRRLGYADAFLPQERGFVIPINQISNSSIKQTV